MTWTSALKRYAEIKGQYVIPKKGTKDYDEVKKIQEQMKSGGTNPPRGPQYNRERLQTYNDRPLSI